MANIAQHEAAELWEISRDHQIAAAKADLLSSQVNDTQLRSTLDQHARRFRQVSQQLESFLHGGSSGFGQSRPGFESSQTFQSSQGFQSSQAYPSGQSFGANSFNTAQSFDAFVVGDCLKECKSMATQAIRGATEASQPARNFLYQLAGEHLQMAEQHYHWLEQRGLYASPKSDQQTIQQYAQALNQIAQVGQNAQRSFTPASHTQPQFQTQQPYAYSSGGFGQASQTASTSQPTTTGTFSQSGYSSHYSPPNQYNQ